MKANALASAAPPPPLSVPVPPFAQVYAEHAPFVWRSLRRLGVRDSDLEDAAQEVFVTVHRKLPGFEGRSALTTWLFGICQRTASDWRRRAHVRREEAHEAVPDQPQEASQPEVVERRQARAILDAILDELDDVKRVAFILFELEGWPMAEVAAAMECPLQTAYARLYAARRHVEQSVARRQLGEQS